MQPTFPGQASIRPAKLMLPTIQELTIRLSATTSEQGFTRPPQCREGLPRTASYDLSGGPFATLTKSTTQLRARPHFSAKRTQIPPGPVDARTLAPRARLSERSQTPARRGDGGSGAYGDDLPWANGRRGNHVCLRRTPTMSCLANKSSFSEQSQFRLLVLRIHPLRPLRTLRFIAPLRASVVSSSPIPQLTLAPFAAMLAKTLDAPLRLHPLAQKEKWLCG